MSLQNNRYHVVTYSERGTFLESFKTPQEVREYMRKGTDNACFSIIYGVELDNEELHLETERYSRGGD